MIEKLVSTTTQNLFATGPGYWFKQKTLYSDFDLLLSRFCTLQILYTVGFALLTVALIVLWSKEHKNRKTKKRFALEFNKENLCLIGVVSMLLLIVGTWLGR